MPTHRSYGPDLAAIQHLGFGDFASRAAPGLLALLRDADIERGTVVDLGCGAGVWLRELARAGYDTVGVDSSTALLDIAHRVARGADLHLGRAEDFDFPACDAVTALGEVLCYVSPQGRAQPLARTFRKIAAALRPGGIFVFDVLVASGHGRLPYRAWRAGESWAVLVEVTEDARRMRVTRDITTFRRVGHSYRRGHERHVLTIANREDVTALLRAAGFMVRTLRRYGDQDLLPGRLAFVARKPRRSRVRG